MSKIEEDEGGVRLDNGGALYEPVKEGEADKVDVSANST